VQARFMLFRHAVSGFLNRDSRLFSCTPSHPFGTFKRSHETNVFQGTACGRCHFFEELNPKNKTYFVQTQQNLDKKVLFSF